MPSDGGRNIINQRVPGEARAGMVWPRIRRQVVSVTQGQQARYLGSRALCVHLPT